MNKTQWKQTQHEKRRATRHACNLGLAIPIAWGKQMAFLATIEKEIAPKLQAMRQAELYVVNGHKAMMENSPETYGQTLGEQQTHYGASGGYRMHSPSSPADCELSETDARLVYCASRNDSPETPLTKCGNS